MIVLSETPQRRDSTAVKIIGIVTLVLALAFTFVFTVIPALYSYFISLRDFTSSGLFGTAWTGLASYADFLGNKSFQSSFVWTLQFTAMSAAILFVLSQAAGCLLLAVGKVKWLRHALCTLLLLPLIVPGELWAQAFLVLFKAGNANNIWPVSFWSGLKYVGLPALLVTASLNHGNRNPAMPLLAGGIAALVLIVLFGLADYSFLRILYTPIGTPSIDLFVFRTGISNNRFAIDAAVKTMLIVLRAVLLAAAAFPIARMLRRLFPANGKPDATTMKNRLISLALPGGVALLALAALLVSSSGKGFVEQKQMLLSNLLPYLVVGIFRAAVSTALCFMLARAAACAGKAGKTAMTAVLLLLTALSMTAYSIGEYMIFHSLGIINTWFAILLSGIGSVWGVWPLLFAAKGIGVSTNTEWFRRMWKPALALFAVQAIFQINNAQPSYLYATQAALHHPLRLLENLTRGNMSGGNIAMFVSLLAFAVMVVPVVLLLAVRTALDEKESLGLFLPGK